MPAIQVIKIIENHPATLYDFEPLTTVDILVDGKHVRMGYRTSELKNAADIKTLLIKDAAIITSAYKQQDVAFNMPTGKTDRPDLVPDSFEL